MIVDLRVLGVAAGALCALFVGAGVAFAVPPDRAFERVSPPGLGADVELGGVARAGAAGDVVAFASFGSLAGAPARGGVNQFRSVREASGWVTAGVDTPLDPYANFGNVHRIEAISADADAGLASGWGSLDYGHPQMTNLWRWDADGSLDLLSQPQPLISIPPDDPVQTVFGNHFAAGTDDLRVVLFGSHKALTSDAPADVDGQADDAYLYRWFEGKLDLVAVLPQDEGGAIVPFATVGYGSPSLALYPGEHAVSADGSRVFFTNMPTPIDPGREIYLRVDDPRDSVGGTTVHVSASERTVPDPTATAAQFQFASGDGMHAFFASPRKLTDDATASVAALGPGPLAGSDSCTVFRCDLYRWDASGADGARLTDLTTGDADGAGVVATVGESEDVSRVYFVAIGDLDPDPDSDAVTGEPNLYLWQEGQGVRYIATLDGSEGPAQQRAADLGVWGRELSPLPNNAGGFRDTRVTPDGRFFVFRSRRSLTGYDTNGHYQVYRFDAVSGSLACVSCNPRANASTGDAFLKRQRTSILRPAWSSRNLLPGGDVVFDSTEALVPEDVNGKIDVYAWAGGDLRLVSSGRDGDDSGFLDASADGRDIFFTTRARLVCQDTDSLVDLYDARKGGGGFAGCDVPPSCSGESCKGLPALPPAFDQPGSESVRGSGNAAPPRKAKARARKPVCRKRGFVRKRVRGKVRCVKRPARHKASHRRGGAR